MEQKINIGLSNVQRTLLLPLWGRAVETQKPEPMLRDTKALEIINSIDYDFSLIEKNIHSLTQRAWVIRSLLMDEAIRKFLVKHPEATIVNIGCGMDTTFERVDNGKLIWYDLDLPDVIELRSNFIHESDRRKFISESFLSDDWLDRLVINDNIMFMAAGLFYYFEEEEVKGFFKKIAEKFPGSEMVFDASSPTGVRASNKLVIQSTGMGENSLLKWGIKNIKDIQKWDSRIKVVQERAYYRGFRKGLSLKHRYLTVLANLAKLQYYVQMKFL